MDDVNDRGGAYSFQVLDERPDVAPVGVGRVLALGGEIVQTLEVSVHDDFFLVSVLERLATGQGPLRALSKQGRKKRGTLSKFRK